MKIAFIGQKGIPHVAGGVETHVEHLSTNLVKHGHEVIVYTRAHYVDPQLTQYQSVQLVNVRHIFTKNLDAISHAFFACIDVWRRKDVDVVHFQSIGPSIMIIFMRLLRPQIAIVATIHSQCYHHGKWGWFARKFLHAGEWVACNFADRVIVVSKTLQEYLHMRHRCETFYIPNGVPIAQIRDIQIIAQKWELVSQGYIFAMARLVEVKRIEDLIEAYNQLKTQKKLVIAWDGDLRNKYVQKINVLAKKSKNIIMVGRAQQSPEIIQELFSHAFLFVLPSSVEGLSITLLEAMSYARGVVVSDIIENTKVVGNDGFTFHTQDVSDLTHVLQNLIDGDFAKITQIGHRAQMRVQKLFNWNSIAIQTEDIYRDVILRKNSKKSHHAV